MKKLGKQDEIIIQNKIEGTLSVEEQKRFNELIDTSSEACKLYQKLLSLHLSLQHDSKNIQTIDFSQKIMKEAEEKKVFKTKYSRKNFLNTANPQKQLLAYAAIFLFGLILGGISTYFVSNTNNTPSPDEVSGTLTKAVKDFFTYNENGTDIKVQKYEGGKYQFYTVSINTPDTLYCTIQDVCKKISDKNITILFSNGKFQIEKQVNGELSYLCSGETIFQITGNDNLNSSKIRFINKNKLIYEYNTE